MLLYPKGREAATQLRRSGYSVIAVGLGGTAQDQSRLVQDQGRSPLCGASEPRANRGVGAQCGDGSGINGRGERKAASGLGFHVELLAERGMPEIGIGLGSHFGAG